MFHRIEGRGITKDQSFDVLAANLVVEESMSLDSDFAPQSKERTGHSVKLGNSWTRIRFQKSWKALISHWELSH